ncbi:MAG: hypothetical protein D6720_09565 [Gammaproteobacteria bacterium]|nr:MAG: hypothetical protein D6720_09565 [Gammaproteobacteria bacterium]
MRALGWAILFGVLVALGYLGARYLATPARTTVPIEVASGCDLSEEGCIHELPDGGTMVLELRPRPIPLMTSVDVEVRVTGSETVPLRLDITGLNMRMAPNVVTFSSVAKGVWRGETIFPVCSQRRMHWQAALTLRNGRQLWLVKDEFYTTRP